MSSWLRRGSGVGLVSVLAVAALACVSCAPQQPPAIEPQARVEPAPHAQAPNAILARDGRYVAFEPVAGGFAWVNQGQAAPIWVDATERSGVRRAAEDLAADVEKVTGLRPNVVVSSEPPAAARVVVIGMFGQARVLSQLSNAGRLATTDVVGRWETSLEQVVTNPWPGTEQALVLAGSDMRGAIYAAYDVSRSIGVSPWYYWDDVPVAHHDALWIRPGAYTQGTPAVRYRGFFINDEAPALANWALATFGPAPNPARPHGFNHHFYAKVFEVLLRLKANYLWPAVWSRSLFDDDPENQRLASDFGVVMGTSHEAPMMRAQDEWDRYGQADGPYGGNGAFSFVRNQATLERYWEDSIRRNGNYESQVTVGMRGNGDVGMEDAQGIELMGRIVTTQRQILEKVTGKPATEVPQVWTMYKEVQRYWEEGMRAPDDVTIIWCDDNWGNLRGLPDAADAGRGGGYGIYYHFDYVGGGRNYKWVDTINLANTWEQLHLAYQRKARQVWVVNVGDLKNVEQPLQFFLDYAWAPEQLPLERLPAWEHAWAAQQFGADHAAAVATVFARYHQLQSRRKPELLNRHIELDPKHDLATEPNVAVVYRDQSPFSLDNYREQDRVTEEWQRLAEQSRELYSKLPETHRDAYFELVHYAVEATANVYALRRVEFLNLKYVAQGRTSANALVAQADALLARDRQLSHFYDEGLANGKWRGFQSQPKLGYGGPYPNSNWQQPEQKDGQAAPDFLWPPLQTATPLPTPRMGVAISDGSAFYPRDKHLRSAEQSPFQTTAAPTIEVFNRGRGELTVRAQSDQPWLTVSPSSATFAEQAQFEIAVDFSRAPKGRTDATIKLVASTGESTVLTVPVFNPDLGARTLAGYVEAQGHVAIEAEHFTRKTETHGVAWSVLPGLGRTGAGVTTVPVDGPRLAVAADNPHLEYDVELFTQGNVTIHTYLSPRLPTSLSDGLLYGISVDDGPVQIVNTTTSQASKPDSRGWERNTSNNINETTTVHQIQAPGRHVVKFWMVDPTVVLQRLVLDTGGLKPSYLGPPESLLE